MSRMCKANLQEIETSGTTIGEQEKEENKEEE